MNRKSTAATTRTMYVEDAKIDRALALLAAINKTSRSAIIRQATAGLVQKEVTNGALRNVSF
jgi:predicted transcriptional regulator